MLNLVTVFAVFLLLTGCSVLRRPPLISPSTSNADLEAHVRQTLAPSVQLPVASLEIASVSDLIRTIDAPVPNDAPFSVFNVSGAYPVFIVKFSSSARLFGALGRVFAWNDRAEPRVTLDDDTNHDQRIDRTDFELQASRNRVAMEEIAFR